jgi:TatD DNase family protein
MQVNHMQLVDTHCHLDVSAFDPDREAVLSRAQHAGVNHIIVPGIHTGNWQAVIALCSIHPGLHAALGLHPVYWQQHRDEDIAALDKAVNDNRPIAIGEIGLDYYIKDVDRLRQVEILRAQLAIAEKHELPVILHVRKAHDAMLSCLKKYNLRGGISHAFNGSLQQAEIYIKERSSKLRKLARDLPLETLVLETDAPDMTVASHHGERNSPEYLPECLSALAEVRNEDIGLIEEQTTRNAIDVLNLPV